MQKLVFASPIKLLIVYICLLSPFLISVSSEFLFARSALANALIVSFAAIAVLGWPTLVYAYLKQNFTAIDALQRFLGNSLLIYFTIGFLFIAAYLTLGFGRYTEVPAVTLLNDHLGNYILSIAFTIPAYLWVVGRCLLIAENGFVETPKALLTWASLYFFVIGVFFLSPRVRKLQKT